MELLTIGDFCVIMVERANIEESKRNVLMNEWLPHKSFIYVGRSGYPGLEGCVLEIRVLWIFIFIYIHIITRPWSQNNLSPKPCSQGFSILRDKRKKRYFFRTSAIQSKKTLGERIFVSEIVRLGRLLCLFT